MVTVVSGEVVAEGAGGQDGGEVIQPGQGGAGVCHQEHDQHNNNFIFLTNISLDFTFTDNPDGENI